MDEQSIGIEIDSNIIEMRDLKGTPQKAETSGTKETRDSISLKARANYWAGEMYLNKYLCQKASRYYYAIFLITSVPSTFVTLLSSVSIFSFNSVINNQWALYAIYLLCF